MAFVSAAEAFAACATTADSADARAKYLKHSGQCYYDGGKCLRAAETYERGRWFDDAATVYREMGRFDNIFEILTKYRSQMKPSIRESIEDVTRLYYVSRKEYG